jgi:hypothetical protein
LIHLVLGRIRRLHGRFQRVTVEIAHRLLPSTAGIFCRPIHALDITKRDFTKVQTKAPIESDFSFQNSRALIPFTSRESSNSGAASHYAMPNLPQDFFRELCVDNTLPQTKNKLELFLWTALSQVSHAPT